MTDRDAVSDTTDETADEAPTESEAHDDHLDDVPVGAGCTEIWEHLSERREADADD